METARATVVVGSRDFEFEICSRTIDFTNAGGPAVEYFWLDTRGLRTGTGLNYRSCVESWWACMEHEGFTKEQPHHSQDELERVCNNEIGLALAKLYPLVAKNRAAKKTVHDAWLQSRTRKSGVERYSLDPQEAQRLRMLAAGGDVLAIGREIQNILVDELPPADERQPFNEAFGQWMTNAVHALRNGGQERLEAFLKDDLLPWLQKYRRRGDQKAKSRNPRLFTNMVEYEARVAFYCCFANAWVLLVPWLREHRDLQPASERLLELMHSQNANDSGEDIFWGQILSMHPSSVWLFESPDHRAVLGRYLASVSSLGAGGTIDNASNPAYWNLVGATLIAFHEYRCQLEVDETARNRDSKAQSVSKNDAILEKDRFERFAESQGMSCQLCDHPKMMFRKQELYDRDEDTLNVTFICGACGAAQIELVSGIDLRTFIDSIDD